MRNGRDSECVACDRLRFCNSCVEELCGHTNRHLVARLQIIECELPRSHSYMEYRRLPARLARFRLARMHERLPCIAPRFDSDITRFQAIFQDSRRRVLLSPRFDRSIFSWVERLRLLGRPKRFSRRRASNYFVGLPAGAGFAAAALLRALMPYRRATSLLPSVPLTS